jgi:hypothetical protein
MNMTDEQYEFTSEQNVTLKRLARIMRYAALLFLLLGAISGIYCGITITKYPIYGAGYLLMAIMAVASGVWTNSVSHSFLLIVETTGKDMDLLMRAFHSLKRVYTLQFIWLMILTLLFIAVLLTNVLSGYPVFSIIINR